jgi:hypothetical protein
MVFYLVVAALVISIIVIAIKNKISDDYYDIIVDVSEVISVVLGVVILFMTVAICIGNFGTDAKVAKYKERYDSLVYQYENEIYCDDNVVYDLLADIREYNEDIAYYQEIQDDFWLGVFYPNVFDQFELIELDEEWYW